MSAYRDRVKRQSISELAVALTHAQAVALVVAQNPNSTRADRLKALDAVLVAHENIERNK